MENNYEYFVQDETGIVLAYKKPNEEPVLINAAGALNCVVKGHMILSTELARIKLTLVNIAEEKVEQKEKGSIVHQIEELNNLYIESLANQEYEEAAQLRNKLGRIKVQIDKVLQSSIETITE